MQKIVFGVIVTPSVRLLKTSYFQTGFKEALLCNYAQLFVYIFTGLCLLVFLQQFGKILDVEIIFNERGSKVSRFFF